MDLQSRQEGLSPKVSSASEGKLVRAVLGVFGLLLEETSNSLLLADAGDERLAYSSEMELFQTAAGWRVRSALLRDLCKDHGAYSTALIDRWLDANEPSYLRDDFELHAIPQTPFPRKQP